MKNESPLHTPEYWERIKAASEECARLERHDRKQDGCVTCKHHYGFFGCELTGKPMRMSDNNSCKFWEDRVSGESQ